VIINHFAEGSQIQTYNFVDRLGATHRHFLLWRTCRGMRHIVIQRYELHFKSAARSVHLLPIWSRRPFV